MVGGGVMVRASLAAMQAHEAAGHTACNQEAEREERWCSAQLLLFIHAWTSPWDGASHI